MAGLLGTVVGIEREWRVKEAGFRTHFLVSLGSALFMIISQWGFEEFLAAHDGLRLDPSRVAAQVVSGIGFSSAPEPSYSTARSSAASQPQQASGQYRA